MPGSSKPLPLDDDALHGVAGGLGSWDSFMRPDPDTRSYGLSSGNDSHSAPSGNVSIDAFNGHDTVLGNTGNDSLTGDGGNDVLHGGAGNDLLIGDHDFGDRLPGPVRPEWVGHDTLAGDAGQDTLRGGLGSDLLRGGADGDLLRGDQGNDTLVGGTGADRLEGGTGDDLIIWEPGDGNDTVSGGDGRDTLRIPAVYIDSMSIHAPDGSQVWGGSYAPVPGGGYEITLPAEGYIELRDPSNPSAEPVRIAFSGLERLHMV